MKFKVSHLLFPLVLLSTTAAHAADFVNSIGMEFKTIPAGSFYMGSCKKSSADEDINKKRQFMGLPAVSTGVCTSEKIDKDADDDEIPKHLVKISRKFQIGVHEVTLGQFKKFIVANARSDLLTDNFIKQNNHGDNAPVVMVSWYDAQAFVFWLNRKENTRRYRLPTEAQWEYAARPVAGFMKKPAEYAWYEDNSNGVFHPVGQKKPNAFGLYDMAGNVAEWVQDYYDDQYYYFLNNPAIDPQGPGYGKKRVIRGGSWSSNDDDLRPTDRNDNEPGDRDNTYGFRIVRV